MRINGSIIGSVVTSSALSATGIWGLQNVELANRLNVWPAQIVTIGSVLFLDASNTNSYPGSGTTWADLSGNNNNGTLTNGPTFSAANGGCIVFDGVNDYVAGGNLGTFYSQGTISYWMYSTAVENYRNPFSTNYLGGNVAIRFEQFTTASPSGGFSVVIGNDAGTYAGYSYSPSAILTVNSWYNVVLVWNTVTNNVIGYLNGDLKFNSSHTYWATTLPAIAIGNGFSSDRYFKGNISSVGIYNRALTATEVLQNFNATRTRFGV